MPRYFLEIAYKGENYKGWQVQKNAVSVQAEVDRALCMLSREEVSCTGCGRTDSGVHASQFYLHFDLSQNVEDADRFIFKLNSILPKDISVYSLHKVDDDSHSRFHASERAYEYHMHLRKNPFLESLSVLQVFDLDVEAMNKAASVLLSVNDFASFCKAGSDVHTTICDVREARWVQQQDRLVFHIRADRFLRNMVRAIVGTLIEVGKGKISLSEFEEIIKSGDRQAAGASVPAHGLYLSEVKYPFL